MSKKPKTQARVVITLDVELDKEMITPPLAYDATDVVRPLMTKFVERKGDSPELIDYLESQGVQINSAGYQVSK